MCAAPLDPQVLAVATRGRNEDAEASVTRRMRQIKHDHPARNLFVVRAAPLDPGVLVEAAMGQDIDVAVASIFRTSVARRMWQIENDHPAQGLFIARVAPLDP